MGYNNYTTTRHTKREQQSDGGEKLFVGGINWIILICTILLLGFGTVMIFSASYDKSGYEYLIKNLMWATVGCICLVITSRIDYNKFNDRRIAMAFYFLVVGLLIAVLVFGRAVGGAKRRILGFQPSELAKPMMILMLAQLLDSYKPFSETHLGFWKCLIIFIGIPTGLVAMGNMSTAIIIAAVCMAMMFTVVAKKQWVFEVVGIGVALVVLVVKFGKGFRSARINAWLNPFSDTSDTGYQVVHSLYAVASGGLSGLGLGNSREKLGYLPEAHNDMIFSIICEELGLLGAFIIVVLFSVLVFCAYRVAIKSYNTFGALIAVGIATMIALQVAINMGVATNTIPNTGIPMPFISYGGSSLVVNMVSIGILLSISRFFKHKDRGGTR